jgi:lipid-A-disaccharide synthase
MRIFISAGEPSGDLHAANLIRSIRRRVSGTDVEFVGYGGAKMAGAGAELLYPLVDLAVMWFLNVLLNLLTFIRLIFKADGYFREHRPDAVVLIDYPGLHWWIAGRAKARGIPVFYFVPPQLWAWAGWRVRKVQKYVDQVLCSLPFEPAWYQERGVPDAVYVGHPYFDELAARPLDDGFLSEHRGRPGPLVAILPGSRTQEVKRNLPDMIKAARELGRRRPDVRFAVACLHERHKAMAERILAEVGAQAEGFGSDAGPATTGRPPAVEVFAARTPELIRLARMAWAVSGSVGLELMADGLPSVVLYKVGRFDLWIARPFIQAKYISLVNLLADEEVFPEYLTWRDASGDLVRWALAWLDETEERARTTLALDALRRRVAHPGATDRAAERIVARLSRRPVQAGAVAAAQSAAAIAYRGPHDHGARHPATGEQGQLR